MPARLAEVKADARQTLQTARARIEGERIFFLERTKADVRYAADAAARTLDDTASLADKSMSMPEPVTQALMREIAGQGPIKTLGRGFALVRDQNGHPVTSVSSTDKQITVPFHDGLQSAQFNRKTSHERDLPGILRSAAKACPNLAQTERAQHR